MAHLKDDLTTDDATRVLARDYYDSVRAEADELRKRLAAKEWDDREEAEEAIREAAEEQNHWSIYTYAAYQCLQASRFDADAFEELEDCGYSERGTMYLCAAASIAYRLDVLDHLGDAVEDHFTALESEDEDETEETGAPCSE